MDAERYDRSRPRYPDLMVQRIIDTSPGRHVLDVGCGTGIAARQFQGGGCTVLGVDVDERMAEFARNSGVDVEVAAFESWDDAGRSFDMLVCGQSWHWIDPALGAVKAAQVLRPAGRVAIFWNADVPDEELAATFGRVYRRVMPDALAARRWTASAEAAVEGCSGLCRSAAVEFARTGAFNQPEQWRFDWERTYTRDEWLDQVPTTGDHGQFPRTQLDDLLAGLGDAIDAAGGRFTTRYATMVVTAARAVAA